MTNHRGDPDNHRPDPDREGAARADELLAAWAMDARLRVDEAEAVYAAVSAEIRREAGLQVARYMALRPLSTGGFSALDLTNEMVKWARAS
jgi:hypothetical protein